MVIVRHHYRESAPFLGNSRRGQFLRATDGDPVLKTSIQVGAQPGDVYRCTFTDGSQHHVSDPGWHKAQFLIPSQSSPRSFSRRLALLTIRCTTRRASAGLTMRNPLKAILTALARLRSSRSFVINPLRPYRIVVAMCIPSRTCCRLAAAGSTA